MDGVRESGKWIDRWIDKSMGEWVDDLLASRFGAGVNMSMDPQMDR